MGHQYDGIPLVTLEAMWDEKRRRIAELPPCDRLPKDIEELFIMRKEISKRRGDMPPTIDVNYSEKYLTD